MNVVPLIASLPQRLIEAAPRALIGDKKFWGPEPPTRANVQDVLCAMVDLGYMVWVIPFAGNEFWVRATDFPVPFDVDTDDLKDAIVQAFRYEKSDEEFALANIANAKAAKGAHVSVNSVSLHLPV